MSVLSSFWDGFLGALTTDQQKTPILFSVLKQAVPLELSEEKIVIGCGNLGVRLFLEKRVKEIENELFLHLNKKMSVEFLVVEKKKQKVEAPLLSFQPSSEDVFFKSGLNSKYSFNNFAVSSTNQVAYAAAQAVSSSPGTAYNPLFLYGGVGVGKTHLAQSVAKVVLETDREKKVFFCPSDHFTNELIESIREKSTPRFRRKYRYLNILIVDDIQFIAGKQHVQEEFFHTFNSIISAGGQIILTSDRPPTDIKNLEDRLRSRFSGGLIVDIQPPDFELRTAILLIKAKEKNIDIDIEAAKIVAEQTIDSRGLEGSLLSIYAKILGVKERIDLEVVESYYSEKTKIKVHRVTPNDIVKAVCSYYNIRQSHIKSEARTDAIALPRQIIMFLLRKELKINLKDIAYLLKRKDHTTGIHAADKISNLIAKDPQMRQDIDNITKSIFPST